MTKPMNLREIVKLNQECGTFSEPCVINWDARYRLRSSNVAVAWAPVGWEPKFELYTFLDENENEYETGEGEWMPDQGGRIAVHMVGDDHIEFVDIDDLEEIDDEYYCSSCGQLGCGWH